MEDRELFMTYVKMPEAQLLALIDTGFKELLEIDLRMTNTWIKNKSCECSENPLIQNKTHSLSCEHLNDVIEKSTAKLWKSIKFQSDILSLRNLQKSKYAFEQEREQK